MPGELSIKPSMKTVHAICQGLRTMFGKRIKEINLQLTATLECLHEHVSPVTIGGWGVPLCNGAEEALIWPALASSH